MRVRTLVLPLMVCLPLSASAAIFESSPDLPIHDNSCLDPVAGRGEGGISDSIIAFTLPRAFGVGDISIQVEIDHTRRSDLQFAVTSATQMPFTMARRDRRHYPGRASEFQRRLGR